MKPKKVLVVDDSKLLHKIFDLMLRNCTVVHAGDGVDGLEKLAKAENADVDLILLDMNMPRMNGLQCLAQIKADKAKAAIPVIVITSYALSGDESKARAAGCDDYVTKPYSPRQVLAKVRSYLS